MRRTIIDSMMCYLLDRFDDFATIFVAARVRTFIRWLFRRWLSAGEKVVGPRISTILGSGRVFPDRIRARLRRIRHRPRPSEACP